jgi:hypothetical protein
MIWQLLIQMNCLGRVQFSKSNKMIHGAASIKPKLMHKQMLRRLQEMKQWFRTWLDSLITLNQWQRKDMNKECKWKTWLLMPELMQMTLTKKSLKPCRMLCCKICKQKEKNLSFQMSKTTIKG